MALWLNAANLLGATVELAVLRGLDERILRLQRTVAALYLLLAALAASAVGALAGCGAAPVYFDSPWTDLLSLWFNTELMNYMLIVPVVLAAPRAADPHLTPGHPLFWRVAPVSSLVLAEACTRSSAGPACWLLWCRGCCGVRTELQRLHLQPAVAGGVPVDHGRCGHRVLLNFMRHAGDVFSLRVGVTLLALGPWRQPVPARHAPRPCAACTMPCATTT